MRVFSRKLGVEDPEDGPRGQPTGGKLVVKSLMEDCSTDSMKLAKEA